MRVQRKQKTLWRVAIVAMLDIFVLMAAAVYVAAATPVVEDTPEGFVISPQPAAASRGIPVTISIETDDTIYLDGIPTDEDELAKRLSDALRISGGSHVTLEPERGVHFRIISNAMAIARTAGAKSLALTVQANGQ